jgi:hypothetical protein
VVRVIQDVWGGGRNCAAEAAQLDEQTQAWRCAAPRPVLMNEAGNPTQRKQPLTSVNVRYP